MSYSEAQKRATIKYKAKAYKRIPLDVRIEEYEKIKATAESRGETVNGFIKKAIAERTQDAGNSTDE